MTNYSSASAEPKKEKPKEEKPAIEKVVEGAVLKKPPITRRLKDMLFGGEFRTAAGYIFTDVALPAARTLMVDAATKGIERLVYGEENPNRRSGRGREMNRPRVSYSTPSRSFDARLPDQRPRALPHRAPAEDVVLRTREEAETVAERLGDIVDRFQQASVADLYELLGHQHSHVDNKWGWTEMPHTTITQIRDGFLLELPPIEPL